MIGAGVFRGTILGNARITHDSLYLSLSTAAFLLSQASALLECGSRVSLYLRIGPDVHNLQECEIVDRTMVVKERLT